MRRTRKFATALVAAAALVTPLAACGGSGSGSSGSGNITLNVGLFGSFGYKEAGLYDQYMKAHPNIKIVESSPQQETDYWQALQTRLAGGGAGLADIQAIEVGRMARVVESQSSAFVDLNTLPNAQAAESKILPWKMGLAKTKTGQQVGIGTDIGPLALCYKPALLKKAGLPSTGAELSSQLKTWDDYIAMGKKFKASAPAKTAWTDSGAGLFRAAMGVTGDKYTDASGKLIYETNPAVASSYQLAANAITAGLTTKLTQFSPQWNQGFSNDAFATIPCPGWMLTYIKGQAGDAGSGQWSAIAPPGGTGNVGGAYLAIPKASKNQKAAWDLVTFLTSAASQKAVFEKAGNFPSNTEAITQVKDYKDTYFGDADTGKILGDSAAAVPAQTIGPFDNDVETALMNSLNEVAQKGTAPAAAFANAKKNIATAVG